MNDTIVKINLEFVAKNVETIIKDHPQYKYYIGVVKSNFYGHGKDIVNELIKGGINYLAVSYLDEALEIRKINEEIPILCLQPISLSRLKEAAMNNITLTIHDYNYYNELKKINLSQKIKVHLKLDTGMNRLGIKNKNEVKKIFEDTNKNIFIEGIFTHFATTGLIDKHYDKQVEKFQELTSLIDLTKIPIIHLANSIVMLSHEKLPYVNGTRLGILMYGYDVGYKISNKGIKNKIKILRNICYQKIYKLSKTINNTTINVKPLMSMQTRIIQIKEVKKGEYIGYGCTYRAKKNIRIAILPIGYANGIGNKNNGRYVMINDKKYDVVGSIGMNMMTISIDKKVSINDAVIILGKGISLGTLSRFEGIGLAEMLINIGNNNKKIYTENKEGEI